MQFCPPSLMWLTNLWLVQIIAHTNNHGSIKIRLSNTLSTKRAEVNSSLVVKPGNTKWTYMTSEYIRTKCNSVHSALRKLFYFHFGFTSSFVPNIGPNHWLPEIVSIVVGSFWVWKWWNVKMEYWLLDSSSVQTDKRAIETISLLRDIRKLLASRLR